VHCQRGKQYLNYLLTHVKIEFCSYIVYTCGRSCSAWTSQVVPFSKKFLRIWMWKEILSGNKEGTLHPRPAHRPTAGECAGVRAVPPAFPITSHRGMSLSSGLMVCIQGQMCKPCNYNVCHGLLPHKFLYRTLPLGYIACIWLKGI
jgi:hypothetical protein